jgi:hypothetical protein
MPEPNEKIIADSPASLNAMEKYKAAIDATQSGVWEPERIMVGAGDVMRPADMTNMPGITHNPPACPKCLDRYQSKIFLYPFSTNPVGDIYFQCLNAQQMNICGYEAIYRSRTRTFEQHPNKPQDPAWVSPARAFNRQPVAPESPTQTNAPEGLITLRTASERLGVEAHALAALAAEGKLPVVKHEGKTYVREEVVIAIIAERDEREGDSDPEGENT